MHWDDQFRETDWERQQRWKATRAKRKAEGKCWQCAKLIAACTCPNVHHFPSPQESSGANTPAVGKSEA